MRLLLTLLAAAALLPAQDRAHLAGVVRDSSGAVLVDVTVTAIDEDTGIRRTARTGGEGAYSIPALAAGRYKISARKVGFRTVARVNVEIAPGVESRVDFVLQVGSIREVITVEGAPEAINREDGSVGTTIGKSLIDGLPLNGRGVLGLVDLAPGVLATPASAGEAGQFTANGLRANTNYFTVDGVSANTGVSGSAVPAQFAGGSLPGMTAFGSTQSLVTMEGLQELRIQTSSFAPEFGRMPGAQVAMTTRSGSDEFHGSLFHSFRNERLNANDWIAASHGQGKAPHRLNHWGATLGGPLRRNRTFFFASYEGLRLRQPYAWRTVTPSLAARSEAPEALRPLLDAFPLPNGPVAGPHVAELVVRLSQPARLDAGTLRIDHALNTRVNLFARYNQAPSSTRFGFSQVDHSEFAARSVTVGATALVTSRLTNDLRVNVSQAAVSSEWLPTGAGGARPVDLRRYLPPVPGYRTALYGVAIGGLGQILSGASGRNHQGQWNIVETLAHDAGTHAFRFGADYQRLTPTRESAALSIAGTWANIADLLSDQPMLVSQSQAEQAASLIETLSVFAQDTWKPRPGLTVTYGLRWELTPAPAMRQPGSSVLSTLPVPTPRSPYPEPGGVVSSHVLPLAPAAGPLWPTRYKQFAPRVGVAWRLPGGPVLRAGWGIFYDLGFSAATDPINGFPYNRWQFSSGGQNPVLLTTGPVREGAAPSLRTPHAREWNLSLEHGITGSDFVALSYVGSAGRNLLRREGTRHPETGVVSSVEATNRGRSDYHGLQFQYRRKMARGLQALVSYTWSHSIDNGSWDSALALAEPGLLPERDRGSSSFDVRHGFAAALSYAPPAFGRPALRRLTRGWTFHGMLRARSGFPIDVLSSENLLGLRFDNVTRPDLVPGVPVWIPDAASFGGRRLNPAAFAVPDGIQGNLGRNAISGFGMSQVDLAAGRHFTVAEGKAFELRLEAFNSLNHASPADPLRYLRHPLFGRPASMLNLMLGSGTPHSGLTPAFQPGGARAVQATLRFRF